MKQKLFPLIKIASTIVTSCALGLEIWQIYASLTHTSLSDQLVPLLWLASILLSAHLIEGLIAGYKANTCRQNFLTYGIYTFFVGFVGLLELETRSSTLEKSN